MPCYAECSFLYVALGGYSRSQGCWFPWLVTDHIFYASDTPFWNNDQCIVFDLMWVVLLAIGSAMKVVDHGYIDSFLIDLQATKLVNTHTIVERKPVYRWCYATFSWRRNTDAAPIHSFTSKLRVPKPFPTYRITTRNTSVLSRTYKTSNILILYMIDMIHWQSVDIIRIMNQGWRNKSCL